MIELQLIDGLAVRAARSAGEVDDSPLTPAREKLLADAQAALRVGPFSVTDLDRLPPSGDGRDYRSWGTYWWPDPDQDDGLPWIRRDGRIHPDAMGNRVQMQAMAETVVTLALAHAVFGDAVYAQRAAELLRVYFTDEATGMRPHLRYAQAIPGRCEGRGIGLIDTHVITPVPDAISLLACANALPCEDLEHLRKWFDAYRDWFATSELGLEEAKTRNNHGTYYDMQLASFALFAGQTDQARAAVARAAGERLPSQIAADGSQPRELDRTLSYGYCCFNLRGYLSLARIGRRVGVDMTSPASEAGVLLRRALDWFEPLLGELEAKWPGEQIDPIEPEKLARLLVYAAATLGEPKYAQWAARLAPLPAEARERLIYHIP